MTAITALLILIGTMFASFGTLAFLAIAATSPDPADLGFAKRIATVGRWTAGPGVLLCLGHGGSHNTPMITLLLVAALAALGTVITKATIPTNPTTT
jgi:hypothetical protein